MGICAVKIKGKCSDMTRPRTNPYQYVTWTLRYLTGEKSCLWAPWFKVNFQNYEKVPSELRLRQVEHGAYRLACRLVKQAEEATEVRVPMTLADAGYLACKHVAEFDCRHQHVVMPAYFLVNPICEIISYPCGYRATCNWYVAHVLRRGIPLRVQGEL